MRNIKTTKYDPSPGPVAWTFGFLSILVMVVIVITIQMAAESVARVLTFNELERSLRSRVSYLSFPAQIDRLQALKSGWGSKLMAWLAGAEGAVQRAALSNEVENLIQLIDSRRFSSARNTFVELLETHRNHLLAALGADEKARAKLSVINENFDDALVVWGSLESELNRKSSSKRDLAGLLTQFELLASDTSELLGLAPEEVADETTPFPVYQEGVLSGVPKLQALRDGIADLTALRDELDLVGGVVAVKGDGAATTFATKLEGLRSDGSALLQSQGSLLGVLTQAAENSSKYEQEIRLISGALRGDLADLLLAELRPETDQQVEELLSTVQTLLPELEP